MFVVTQIYEIELHCDWISRNLIFITASSNRIGHIVRIE